MDKYKNKKVAILGYGIEGRDAVAFLKKAGAEVSILDQKLDPTYLNKLQMFDIIIRSPGVYRFKPEIVEAEKFGVIVTSAIKIFFENCPAKIIGVTGTKGKGTTSTLIYEILKAGGYNVFLAGNIGKPFLELLPKLTKNDYVILEMSSFQLIDLDISPHIAVVLNITLDHMDWHKDREEYINAKKNIVLHQNQSDYAVINEEYDTSKSFANNLKSEVVFFSKKTLEDKFQNNLLLRGIHNLENIAAAVEVGKIAGVDEKIIEKIVKKFKGLEHRLELVASVDGRTFYNDSFSTGPQPAIAAIESFTEPETVIFGGSDKGLDYSELGEIISKKANVKNILLIGLIGSKIGEALLKAGYKGRIEKLGSPKMEEIVRKAYEVTPSGGVVILSPAAASFDMFKNYKERGDQFKESVMELSKSSP